METTLNKRVLPTYFLERLNKLWIQHIDLRFLIFQLHLLKLTQLASNNSKFYKIKYIK